MSHSRANITEKARQPAETSSSLAGSQTVVLVPTALLSRMSRSRLVSSGGAPQVWPQRSIEVCTVDHKTGEKLPLLQ